MARAGLLAALGAELQTIAVRLERLQDVPLLDAGGEGRLSGDALMQAMVALQDLDRLAQDARGLAGFAATAAEGGGDDYAVDTALEAMTLRSLADRMRQRLAVEGW